MVLINQFLPHRPAPNAEFLALTEQLKVVTLPSAVTAIKTRLKVVTSEQDKAHNADFLKTIRQLEAVVPGVFIAAGRPTRAPKPVAGTPVPPHVG